MTRPVTGMAIPWSWAICKARPRSFLRDLHATAQVGLEALRAEHLVGHLVGAQVLQVQRVQHRGRLTSFLVELLRQTHRLGEQHGLERGGERHVREHVQSQLEFGRVSEGAREGDLGRGGLEVGPRLLVGSLVAGNHVEGVALCGAHGAARDRHLEDGHPARRPLSRHLLDGGGMHGAVDRHHGARRGVREHAFLPAEHRADVAIGRNADADHVRVLRHLARALGCLGPAGQDLADRRLVDVVDDGGQALGREIPRQRLAHDPEPDESAANRHVPLPPLGAHGTACPSGGTGGGLADPSWRCPGDVTPGASNSPGRAERRAAR